MIRALWSEICRSPLRWWLPFLIFVDVAMLFGRSRDWIGVWPQASAAAQLSVFYIAIFLASGSAWAAGRIWRADVEEQFGATALPGWQRETIQLLSSLAYGIVPFVIGAIVATAVSYRDAGPGFLWPSYLLLGFILLVVSASLGHLIGRTVRNQMAAPLLGPIVIFMLVGFFSWFELSLLSGAPFLRIQTGPLLARAALALAIAVVAVTAGAVVSRNPLLHKLSSAVVPTVLVLSAAAGIIAAGPLRVERTPPQPLCSQTSPRVCLWPEHRVFLADMTQIAGRLGELSDVVEVPNSFYEEGLRAPRRTNSDFALVLGEWSAARGMVSAVMNETLGLPACNRPPDDKYEDVIQASIEFKEWMVARAFGPKPDDIQGGFEFDEAELSRVLGLPDEEQKAWATAKIKFILENRCA